MRFRILDLMVATAFCGFTCAGLIQADPLFECLSFSVALLTVLASALFSIALTGSQRAFWLGFLVASGAYLAFAHIPDSNRLVPRHNGPEFTTQLLRLAFSKLHSANHHTVFSPQEVGVFSVPSEEERVDPFGGPADSFSGNLSIVVGGGQQIISDGRMDSFMRIGHSAWAILFGWLGGQFTCFVYQRSRRQPVS